MRCKRFRHSSGQPESRRWCRGNDFPDAVSVRHHGHHGRRPKLIETTALGAAFLSRAGGGFWKSTAELSDKFSIDREFEPTLPFEQREQLGMPVGKAVTRAQHWVD